MVARDRQVDTNNHDREVLLALALAVSSFFCPTPAITGPERAQRVKGPSEWHC